MLINYSSATNNVDPYKNPSEADSRQITIDDGSIPLFVLWKRQMLAIWYKKFVHFKRSWLRFSIHFLLPIIFIALAYYAGVTGKSNTSAIEGELFDLDARFVKNLNFYFAINDTASLDSAKFIKYFEQLARKDGANPIVLKDKSLFQGKDSNMFLDKCRNQYLKNIICRYDESAWIGTLFIFRLYTWRH